MNESDDRVWCDTHELEESSHTLVHRILKLIRECEVYGIDYDSYIDKLWLQEVIEILDCCIKNKDSKYIERV